MDFYKSKNNIERIVILGSNGFVGSEIIVQLKKLNIPFLSISRDEIDLVNPSAIKKISKVLKKNDILVIASAIAPVKNQKMLTDNIIMMNNICQALSQKNVKKILYISSDAVYADKIYPLNEESITNPVSLHGIMHLTREMMLKELTKTPLAIIRPTLIYGQNDPHNGYGPNSFNRLVKSNKNINLFGKGEERRDHVHILDVANLCCRVICEEFEGVLNIATGEAVSFYEVAKKILKLYNNNSQITYVQRKGQMPHDGFRSFDSSKTYKTFTKFRYTLLDEGVSGLKIKI